MPSHPKDPLHHSAEPIAPDGGRRRPAWIVQRIPKDDAGFTLIEVLVALAIVAVALGAAIRATGVIAGNDENLRQRALATVAAENRLAELRLTREFPAIGRTTLPCPMGRQALQCSQTVEASVNANMRLVTIRVHTAADRGQTLATLGGLVERGR